MLDIAEELHRWVEQGRDFAVATVVAVGGSAPRPTGAALAVDAAVLSARVHRGGRTAGGHRTGRRGAGSRGRRWLTDRGVGRAAVEQRMSKRATESNLTGVAMYQMVRARVGALVGGVLGAVRRRAARRDAGMVTSEYAMGIVAAVAFAVVLYKVVTSGTVSAELQGIVKGALDARM